MADEKQKTGRPLGPTGEAIRVNLRQIRDAQGISGAQLSTRLDGIERKIPPLGIQRIEAGERRIDVDDLVAFSVALGVSPITLLMPAADSGDAAVSATAIDVLPARELLMWLRGDVPLSKYWGSPAPHRLLPEWFSDERQAARERDRELMDDLVAAAKQVLEKDRVIAELTRQIEELQARGDD